MYQSVIDSMGAVRKFSDEWFRLKEMEISLRNDELAADQVGGDGNSVNEDKNTTAGEVAPASPVEDSTGAAAVNEKLHAGKAELIDDDISPDANTGLLHDGSLSYKKKSAASRPETIKEDSSCPMPFYAMDDDVHNRNTGQVATSKSYGSSAPSCDEQSILYPSLEETDGHASIGLKERSASGGDHLEPFNTPSSPPLEGAPLVHQHQHHLTREPSKTLLIEAWAVDESSTSEIDDRTVYIAEEMTGCYTSKAKAIAGLCTVIVVVFRNNVVLCAQAQHKPDS
jgi:hypothetical protein